MIILLDIFFYFKFVKFVNLYIFNLLEIIIKFKCNNYYSVFDG